MNDSVMREIRGIVFDFDGTLVDASDAICAAFNHALSDAGLSAMQESWIRSRIGRPLLKMFAEVEPQASEDTLERRVDAYRTHFFPMSRARSRALPGAAELLGAISSRCRLGIATSRKSDGAHYILDGLGLTGFFHSIIGIEAVTSPKPAPESVLLALSQMGVDPSKAMMVGDTPDDMGAGRSAGVFTVGVTTGAHDEQALRDAGAHAVVKDLHGLRVLLPGDVIGAPR